MEESAGQLDVSNGLWRSIIDFLNFQLLKIGDNDKSIIVTIGLIIVLIVALFLTRILLRLVYKVVTRKLNSDEKLRFKGVYNFVTYFIYALVFVSILSSSGIDISIILAATTVLFIGLGLAMRELFQDIIGGLYIIMDKSVLAGEIIEINGYVGKVIDIKLRTARLLTRDEKVIVLPNHLFITEQILNYSQNFKRIRQGISFRLPVDSNIEVVEQLLIDRVKEIPGVLSNPLPFLFLEKFGDYALHMNLYYHLEESFMEPKISSEVRKTILKTLTEYGIQIPLQKMDVEITSKNNPSA